ncbi:MAG: hypothetical protein KAH38_08895 [Candidatus Hydrogenedentes bacterium]|nr:hypothetical protein [Candidatus Hydrogenedentota bacterium]
MAYGDLGGPVTELIITCKTPSTGDINITRGDAVKLIGPYEVDNTLTAGDRIFGQALAACSLNNTAIPVRVRGICDFAYSGAAPAVDGISGIVGATGVGAVQAGTGDTAAGIMVKVNNTAGILEALL